MKKILSILLLLFFVITLTGCNTQTSSLQSDNEENNNIEAAGVNDKSASNYPMSSAELVVDKLEVYYFHRTARCYSCKTIERYVREIIEQKYGEQIKNGIIDFRELNVELPENKEIARKFKASGSSLFINRVIDGQDNIEQDINVWGLLGNEVRFKTYLENKINSYLKI